MDMLGMFKNDLGKARARLQKVRQDLETARDRWEELKSLPPPPEEIVERLMKVLHRRAGAYDSALKQRIRSLAPDCGKPDDTQGLQASMLLLQNPAMYAGQELEGLLVFSFREQIEAALLASVKTMGLKCGPSVALRAAEMSRLDGEIRQLEDQEKAIVAEFESLRAELTVKEA